METVRAVMRGDPAGLLTGVRTEPHPSQLRDSAGFTPDFPRCLRRLFPSRTGFRLYRGWRFLGWLQRQARLSRVETPVIGLVPVAR